MTRLDGIAIGVLAKYITSVHFLHLYTTCNRGFIPEFIQLSENKFNCNSCLHFFFLFFFLQVKVPHLMPNCWIYLLQFGNLRKSFCVMSAEFIPFDTVYRQKSHLTVCCQVSRGEYDTFVRAFTSFHYSTFSLFSLFVCDRNNWYSPCVCFCFVVSVSPLVRFA